jgi:hypothetical protein
MDAQFVSFQKARDAATSAKIEAQKERSRTDERRLVVEAKLEEADKATQAAASSKEAAERAQKVAVEATREAAVAREAAEKARIIAEKQQVALVNERKATDAVIAAL